ncbi:hypothetical protein [Pseudomonas luteola]|uniref:hypothetical protein n=1 Tax=Pseudomonas luteola TaxID=47886 RepID=UPI0015E431BE|nr:hypothetical protein [Pseudomonas zeshuii]MBA1249891.1 hypothetical protein [Pseudomonas zeshuii]
MNIDWSINSHKYGVPDFKDDDGLWIASYRESKDGISTQHHTRAGYLWADLQKRTAIGGRFQHKRPTYAGCQNKFESFQEFASWANNEPGYSCIDENGNFYQLDKDLLSGEDKVYSKETCAFIPSRINSLLNVSRPSASALPLGVSLDPSTDKYRARSKHLGKMVSLGSFSNVMEAHKAWQLFKSKRIYKEVSDFIGSPAFRADIAEVLMAKACRLEAAANLGVLTEKI